MLKDELETISNPNSTSAKIRKTIILISIITMWISFTFDEIHNYDDLTLISPFYLLPQESIFSFVLGYFAVKGKIFTSTALTISLVYLGILYPFKRKKETLEDDLISLQEHKAEELVEKLPQNEHDILVERDKIMKTQSTSTAISLTLEELAPIRLHIAIVENITLYTLILTACYNAFPSVTKFFLKISLPFLSSFF